MKARRAILVVDDEAVLLLAIKQELRMKFGERFLCEAAMSAEQGLAAIDRLADDGVETVLVISDWLMPGMKGDEFLRLVHQVRPSVKLVMLSGHAEKDRIEELASDVDLFAYMSKPYDSGEFIDMVHRALMDA